MKNVYNKMNKQVNQVTLSQEDATNLIYSNELYLGNDIRNAANLNMNKIHYSAKSAYAESDEYKITDKIELQNLIDNGVTEEHLITS